VNDQEHAAPSPEQARLIQEAVALHQSGLLYAAENQYHRLLAALPNNIDLLTNLGTIAFQKGNLEVGIEIIARSLRIDPNQAGALNNQGNALQQLKRLDEALISYDRAIALRPDYAEAYCNRAHALRSLNRLEEALDSYDRAIGLKSDYAEAYFYRGSILRDLNRPDQALASFGRVIALRPDHADAHFEYANLLLGLNRLDEAVASYDRAIVLHPEDSQAYCSRGVALQRLGRLDEALSSYDRAVALDPDYAEAYRNRGVALQGLKQFEEALASFDRVVALKPDDAEAYCNCCTVLQDLNRFDEALKSCDHAIALNPDYAEAYYDRGNILRGLERLDDALESYDRAIALKPDYAGVYSNRGTVLQGLKRLDEALADYDCAISLKPDLVDAHWNKSQVKILIGEYLEGWNLYEWRWKTTQFANFQRHYNKKLWLGGLSIINKTLIVYREQGLGDYIQSIRYALLAEQAGARVILEVPAPLMSLVSTLKGNFTLVETGAPLPEFDYHCPVMSLPLAFKTTVETIPAQIPYLFADEAKKKQWRKNLGEKTKPRIGLVWSGTSNHRNDHNRSFPLRQLSDLLDLPFEFHSLQKDVRAVDIDALEEFSQVHQHQDDLLDFSDTAALVDAMDIVISVDTSVAHLAGAMGKSLFVLLPFAPDYRWMLDRSDSPWYPTARLFRQPALYDWDSVIAEVKLVLMEGAWLKEPKDRDQMDRLSSTR
jgi:tetratricopeptide (TPR) repeat protein